MLRVFQPVPRCGNSRCQPLRLPLWRPGGGGPGPDRRRRRHERRGDQLPDAGGADRRRRRSRRGAGPGRPRRRGDPLPQYPGLRRGFPRPAAGRRDGHHRQLPVHGGRDRPPARRRRRGVAVYRLGPAPRSPGSRHPGRDPGRAARRPRRRRRPPLAAGPADRRRPGAGRQLRPRHPRGRAAVLLRDHRPAQGRDAQPPEPRGERGAVPRAAQGHSGGPAAGAAAVLPHLRTDRAAEPRPAPARPPGHDAEVRAGRVPADHPGPQVQLPVHRPAGGRGPVQAPAGGRLRPQLGAHHPVRRGARSTANWAAGWPNALAAGCCRATA